VIITSFLDLILMVFLWHTRAGKTRQLVRLGKHAGMRNESAIRRSLNEAASKGFLSVKETTLKRLSLPDAPLCRFHPDHEVPSSDEAERLSYRLIKRWNEAEVGGERIWTAGERAIEIFGGATKGVVSAGSVSHDVLVTELYIRLLTTDPVLAATWVGEDASPIPPKHGQKVPDAILHASTGEPLVAMEIGGMYPPERIIGLWKDCARRGLALEIW